MEPTSFIPPNLPPQLDLSSILKLVADTRDALARYDESIKRLPNPMLIRRSFETKEAVLSSRIEGTQASLREVFEYDARAMQDRTTEKRKDYEEIYNYRQAMNEERRLLAESNISIDMICELHAVLLNSVRGKDKQPGNFRQNQVYIGYPGATIEEAVYIPPPHTEVNRLMENLIYYLQTNYRECDKLI